MTDSPWFWLGLFGLSALVALVAIGPKFQRRHARLELQSQVREQVWRGQLVQPGPQAGDAATVAVQGTASEPATDGAWLWPLGGLAAIVTMVCWSRLWWLRRSEMKAASGACPEADQVARGA